MKAGDLIGLATSPGRRTASLGVAKSSDRPVTHVAAWTQPSGVYALQERRGVFPVRASGGDALKVFSEIERLWPATGIWGIGQAAFVKTLAQDVRTRQDAQALAEGLRTLLVDHVSIYDSDRRRSGLFLSYAREDGAWLDIIKLNLRSVPATLWDDRDIAPGGQ
jgi:hypothetical protein